MDLRLFLRVAGRFRLLMLSGLTLALVLATLSYVRIEFENGQLDVSHRSDEQWASYTRLLLTQPGFKWGSSLSSTAGDPEAAVHVGEQAAIEGRLPTLATIYATFVTSDPVTRLMLRQGPIEGAIHAQALPSDASGNSLLPIVNISATGKSIGASQQLAVRAADALRVYVANQQRANGVAPEARVQLRYLNRAGFSELVIPRKKTVPIVVFLLVMFATTALAFVLENLRPAVHPLRVEPVRQPERAESSRRAIS
jgi:hypothetical protein